MKLVDKLHKHPPFDVSRGMAEALLATGTVEEFQPDPFTYVDASGVKRVRLAQNLTWVARQGPISNDGSFRYSPEIYWKCSSCGIPGTLTGATVHKTGQVRCCGGVASVPKDVQAEYARLRKEYEKTPREVKREKGEGGVLTVPSAVLGTW